MTLSAREMSAIVWQFEWSLALPFFGPCEFSSPVGHCWVFQFFQNSWHIECITFTASSFRNWNSSTEILSPPLALFIVMLPKACLISHSRVSGSGWVITPSWLSGPLRFFLQFFCVFLPPLLNLFCLLGPYCFCPLLCPFLHEMLPWYLWFSWRDLWFFHSFIFLCFFALFT